MSLLLLAAVHGALAQGSFDTVNFNNRLTAEGIEAQVNDTTTSAMALSGGTDSAQLCIASIDHAVLGVRAWTAGTGAICESADATANPSRETGESNLITAQTQAGFSGLSADMANLQSIAVTPVPEADVVWLGSIGLALVALKFRFTNDRQGEDERG